jgi:ABC-2 type transport system permease protein
MTVWQRIHAVARREMAIIRHRPVYLWGSIGGFVFSTIFFLTLMNEGTPEKNPVGFVDMDHSTTSRMAKEALDATQLVRIIPYDTQAEASRDMMKGKLMGYIIAPKDLNDDLQAYRRPKVTFYTNELYFIGGTMAWKQLLTLANLGNGAVEREFMRARGYRENEILDTIEPIVVDTHYIGNPEMNYNYYISPNILAGILELLVIIVLVYSFSTELKYGTSRHLLKTSGNSILVAIGGKLLVWTLIFCTVGFSFILLIYGILHFPYEGNIGWQFLDMLLMILASEGVALFLVEMVPVSRMAICLGALYSILGYTMTGFSLPIEAMPAAAQGWSWAFPVRHYYLMYVQEGIFATGFAGCWKEIIAMLSFLFLPLLGLGRLKKAYIYLNYPRL